MFDKHTFVMTKDVLLQQTGVCCNKTFVASKMVLVAAPTNDSILYCLLLRASKISCIHRKDALSTQCSHKPAYCILYLHTAFSTRILHSLLLRASEISCIHREISCIHREDTTGTTSNNHTACGSTSIKGSSSAQLLS